MSTTAKKPEQRALLAWSLHKGGMTQREVATAMGVKPRTVQRYLADFPDLASDGELIAEAGKRADGHHEAERSAKIKKALAEARKAAK